MSSSGSPKHLTEHPRREYEPPLALGEGLRYAAGVRLALLLAILGGCGFSISAENVDAPVDVPSDVPVTWAVDPTSGKPCPASAFEWQDFLSAKGLQIAPPDGLWLLQEANGVAADTIGTVNLMPFGTIGYRLPVTGWSRSAIGLADNTVAGLSNMSAPSLPDVGFFSMTILVLVAFPSLPPAPRSVLFAGSGSPMTFGQVNVDSARHFRLMIDATSATGSMDHGAAPIALVLKIDRTNSQQKIITKQETIAVPYSPLGSSRGLFLGGANDRAPDSRWLYMAAWYGGDAEITDAKVASLISALDW